MKKTLLILSSILTLSACSDSFLERLPKGYWHHGNYTDDNQLDNKMLAQAKIFECNYHPAYYGFVAGVMCMESITTPDAEKGSVPADGGAMKEFKPMSFTPSNGTISSFYKVNYESIYLANEALALVQGIDDNDPEKNRLTAEALFNRAAAYFFLNRAFGGVPYVDHVLGQTEKTPARSSEEQIYDYVRRDLEWAINYLPTRIELVNSENYGHPTKNAARAIIAKSYMQQHNWNEAIKYTRAIIESGDNDLSTPFAEVFIEANEFGPESVYEIEADYKPDLKINRFSQWSQIQGIRGIPNLGWGFGGPSQKLMDAFEPGDPRKAATVISDGEILDGGVKVIAASGAYPYFNRKVYPLKSERTAWGRGDTNGAWVNPRVIRYSDVVLMHAECANEIGDTKEALEKLEMVRARARGNNPDILPKVTTEKQDELRKHIQHERQVELALEFGRYYDYIRWGNAKDEIPNFVVGKHEHFPIPQGEIDASNGIITQNPGY